MTRQTPNLGRRRLLAAVPLLATGLYLQPALADPTVQQASRTLMGTRVDMTVQSGSGSRETQLGMSAAFAEMQRLSDAMSRYRSGNALHSLHLLSGIQAVVLEAEIFNVLQMAQARAQSSQGAFDITVGALSWDFSRALPSVPNVAEVAQELALVNYRDLALNAKSSTAYLRQRGMRIDLGGIAKLPILNAGMQVLQRHGIQHAMINGGGDVVVHGQLQGRDWRVGLRDPRAPERIVGALDLSEGFVAASGDYERFFLQNGHRYHHILSPKTGSPTAGPHGVTLVSRKLEDINGLGAAIMVAGADTGRQWLQSLQHVDALIVEPNQRLWLSPGMALRLRS